MSLLSPDSSSLPSTAANIESSSIDINILEPAPANIDLFFRNIRLLDLPIQSDWPSLTLQTFRTGRDAPPQKQRISLAEHILVKLFELWNPKEARLKLAPYFPALEPRQSIHLRANLFAWLDELKKKGELGRECPLRKSTLDECRGERFEELLFLFSAAVLRKVVRERQAGKGVSVAEELALARALGDEDETRAQVVQVALKKSLRERMREKEDMRKRHLRLQGRLDAELRDMDVRAESAMSTASRYSELASMDNLNVEDMKQQLRNQGSGISTWLNLLISGDPRQGRSGFIEDDWDAIWNMNLTDTVKQYDEDQGGMLADLDNRVLEQQRRLSEWRAFQTELSKRNEVYIVPKTPSKTPSRTPFKTPAKTTKPSPSWSPTKRSKWPTPSPGKTVNGRTVQSVNSTKARPQSMQLSETSRKLSQVIETGQRGIEPRDGHSTVQWAQPPISSSPSETSGLEQRMANMDLDQFAEKNKGEDDRATAADASLSGSEQITAPLTEEPQASVGQQESTPPTSSTYEPSAPINVSQPSSPARERSTVPPSNTAAYSPSIYPASPPPTHQPPERTPTGSTPLATPPRTLVERTRESIAHRTTTRQSAQTHRKTRSVQASRPTYPINPFDSPSQAPPGYAYPQPYFQPHSAEQQLRLQAQAQAEAEASARRMQAYEAELQRVQAELAARDAFARQVYAQQAAYAPPAQLYEGASEAVPVEERERAEYASYMSADDDYASVFKARPRIRVSPKLRPVDGFKSEKEWGEESADEKEIL